MEQHQIIAELKQKDLQSDTADNLYRNVLNRLDTANSLSLKDIANGLSDCYMDGCEDALTSPLQKLQDLHKNLRGDNRSTLEAIITQLHGIAEQLGLNQEYTNDGIRKTIKELKGE